MFCIFGCWGPFGFGLCNNTSHKTSNPKKTLPKTYAICYMKQNTASMSPFCISIYLSFFRKGKRWGTGTHPQAPCISYGAAFGEKATTALSVGLACLLACMASEKLGTLLDLCMSSLRKNHANLLCIVPILSDDPRGVSVGLSLSLSSFFLRASGASQAHRPLKGPHCLGLSGEGNSRPLSLSLSLSHTILHGVSQGKQKNTT